MNQEAFGQSINGMRGWGVQQPLFGVAPSSQDEEKRDDLQDVTEQFGLARQLRSGPTPQNVAAFVVAESAEAQQVVSVCYIAESNLLVLPKRMTDSVVMQLQGRVVADIWQDVSSTNTASLVLGAAKYIEALAILPVDPEADRRIEKLMAKQPRRGSRRLLPRK